jgi:hypothetical protein
MTLVIPAWWINLAHIMHGSPVTIIQAFFVDTPFAAALQTTFISA